MIMELESDGKSYDMSSKQKMADEEKHKDQDEEYFMYMAKVC